MSCRNSTLKLPAISWLWLPLLSTSNRGCSCRFQLDEEAGEEEVEDPRAELVARLLEYQKYKEASIALCGQRELFGRDVFVRELRCSGTGGDPCQERQSLEVELFDLIEAFRKITWRQCLVESFHEVGAEGP
jgi:segregation and condensation protein A